MYKLHNTTIDLNDTTACFFRPLVLPLIYPYMKPDILYEFHTNKDQILKLPEKGYIIDKFGDIHTRPDIMQYALRSGRGCGKSVFSALIGVLKMFIYPAGS
jgi:hypothetical protein